jgi:hypothetical protein
MALEAQSRRRYLERILVDGTMRIVAAQAVLAHRCVLEQKRSALFGMAFVAIVVDGIFPQERLGSAAMRVVAIRADHFALTHRHVRWAVHLGAPVLMALEASFGFECRFQLAPG